MAVLVVTSVSANAEPQPNRYFLHDDANVYVRNPKVAEDLEEMLRAFNLRGMGRAPLHVVTTTSTAYNKDLLVFTNDVRKRLLKESQGFVLVYEIDSGMFNLSIREFDEDSSKENWSPSIVPQQQDHDLQVEWHKRIAQNNERKFLNGNVAKYNPMESCTELSITFMDIFEQFVKDNPQPKKESTPYVIVTFSMLGLFVVVYFIRARMVVYLAREKVIYRFPAATCNTAFGSPNSGGDISSITFGT